jgi:D-threo-aldose 1-dehydrogenase
MAAPMQWPRLGIGCASLGAPELADRDAEATMTSAVQHGIRFFDVAPLYGGGLAEVRLGRVLRHLPRDGYLLCTKTGVTRAYGQPPMPPGATRPREFDAWDYSADATRRSVATSLQRLQVDRLDAVHLHDVEGRETAALEAHEALVRLREEGVVGAIGIGSNLVAPVAHLLERAAFDAFLLAGRYTLLDQAGAELFAAAHARGVRTIAGGVFNSGVLAAWPQAAPTFGYQPASPVVVARTGQIAAICARHAVPLGAVALRFVAANPAISTVLIGPRSVMELEHNLEWLRLEIPQALWRDLEDEALVPSGSAHAAAALAPLS